MTGKMNEAGAAVLPPRLRFARPGPDVNCLTPADPVTIIAPGSLRAVGPRFHAYRPHARQAQFRVWQKAIPKLRPAGLQSPGED